MLCIYFTYLGKDNEEERDASEREKEPRKTKTEVEGCHSERYEAEQDRGWCMEGQEQLEEGLQSGRPGLVLERAV